MPLLLVGLQRPQLARRRASGTHLGLVVLPVLFSLLAPQAALEPLLALAELRRDQSARPRRQEQLSGYRHLPQLRLVIFSA
jgi:hypothetical protein